MGLDMEALREQLEARVRRDSEYQAQGDQAIRDAFAIEKCQTCGGYTGQVNARYARHHDACSCERDAQLPRCHKCGHVFPDQEYRVADGEGHDHCTYCAEANMGKDSLSV